MSVGSMKNECRVHMCVIRVGTRAVVLGQERERWERELCLSCCARTRRTIVTILNCGNGPFSHIFCSCLTIHACSRCGLMDVWGAGAGTVPGAHDCSIATRHAVAGNVVHPVSAKACMWQAHTYYVWSNPTPDIETCQ